MSMAVTDILRIDCNLTCTKSRLVNWPASSPAINSSAVASRSSGSTDALEYWATTLVNGANATKTFARNHIENMVLTVMNIALLREKVRND